MMWTIGISIGIILGAVGLLIREFYKRSREEFRKNIESFEAGPQMSNEDYLAVFGFEADTPQAYLAVRLREHISEYSHIPLTAVLPEHELENDYGQLLFDVSHDVADFIFQLEKKMDIHVSRKILYLEDNQTVQGLTIQLIDQMKITPEGKYSVRSFNKPGQAPFIGGALFCTISLLFAVMNFKPEGIIGKILLCISILFAIPGVTLLLWALKDLICSAINDRKINEKCSDCGSLLRQVETYGCDGPGQRWYGTGIYCKNCKDLKRCEKKSYGER